MDILENELRYTISENKKAAEQTSMLKKNLIDELRNGLGEELKNNNLVHIVKRPLSQKIKEALKSFFTNF